MNIQNEAKVLRVNRFADRIEEVEDKGPHLLSEQSSNDNRCIFEDLHLHPGVDDRRQDVKTDHTEHLQHLDGPHGGPAGYGRGGSPGSLVLAH